MHPAEGMGGYSELAGIVGDDGRVLEQAVAADAAPERAFGGDLDWVGVTSSRVTPSASRWACQADRSAKCRIGCALSWSSTGPARSWSRM